MKKDFKIGLAVGLLFVVAVAFWLSSRPDFSTEARALQSASNRPVNTGQFYRDQADETQTPNVEQQVSSNEQQTINTEQLTRIHVVQKGETLSGIAAKYYGSTAQWQKILNANHETLNNPNRLNPGSRLIIPE